MPDAAPVMRATLEGAKTEDMIECDSLWGLWGGWFVFGGMLAMLVGCIGSGVWDGGDRRRRLEQGACTVTLVVS